MTLPNVDDTVASKQSQDTLATSSGEQRAKSTPNPTTVDAKIAVHFRDYRNKESLERAKTSVLKQEGLLRQFHTAIQQVLSIDYSRVNNAENSSETYDLNDFLKKHALTPSAFQKRPRDAKRDEFARKLNLLKERYRLEQDKINQVRTSYIDRLTGILGEQSQFRTVSQQEVNAKIQAIDHRFNYAKKALYEFVCKTVSMIQKQYNQPKRKRQTLSKRATGILEAWFFAHLSSPYPTEEQKNELAKKCELTTQQINNWFGNKRIRYKRKIGDVSPSSTKSDTKCTRKSKRRRVSKGKRN